MPRNNRLGIPICFYLHFNSCYLQILISQNKFSRIRQFSFEISMVSDKLWLWDIERWLCFSVICFVYWFRTSKCKSQEITNSDNLIWVVRRHDSTVYYSFIYLVTLPKEASIRRNNAFSTSGPYQQTFSQVSRQHSLLWYNLPRSLAAGLRRAVGRASDS